MNSLQLSGCGPPGAAKRSSGISLSNRRQIKPRKSSFSSAVKAGGSIGWSSAIVSVARLPYICMYNCKELMGAIVTIKARDQLNAHDKSDRSLLVDTPSARKKVTSLNFIIGSLMRIWACNITQAFQSVYKWINELKWKYSNGVTGLSLSSVRNVHVLQVGVDLQHPKHSIPVDFCFSCWYMYFSVDIW